ncbi:helix-turn-helix domain-containing protein [Natronolimnohabitans sp. A-GB9]|uniref:helix-turn-helix transcriptional regulator n=1 Tax=Natronolimnohabitans sp. A-GB9 TaxID=3069757 RepID=UPI0027B7DD26|nr:helix-turn-helix domain-containing protein [Natronolimnohabitans sp. A-GB9]MDQ2049653.1 helix-turn-helix domain-containing protein [Natronolimnohabitans sp. A-GB9]
MNRSASVGVVVLVAALLVLVGVTPVMADTGTAGSTQTQQSALEPAMQSQSDSFTTSQDFDRTTFEITVHENGSATWTFQHQQWFDGDNESEEREAFEAFAEEFESEETDLYEGFVEQAEGMAESGVEETDREMEATNFQRSATVDDQFGARGIVEMTFVWEGFADVDDDGTVRVGDVFTNMYLAEDQRLMIVADDDLTFDQIDPEGSAEYQGGMLERADWVRWSGEQQFFAGQPGAVLVQNGGAGESTSSWTIAGDAPWLLAIGVLAALALAGGAVWYRRRSTDGASGGLEHEQPGPDAAASAARPPDSSSEPTVADDGASETTDPLPDEELLTDEDRVVKLIRENGGRMKQVNIVEETGWSKSKVSMLLSDMEEEGTISKLRVGRENIISLEGFEPEATKSPFEE